MTTQISEESDQDLALMENIPLVDAVLWTRSGLPRWFFAPPQKDVSTQRVNLSNPPTLDPPNEEKTIAELKIAASQVTEFPLLSLPAITSPVRRAAPQESKEIPQTPMIEPENGRLRVISLAERPATAIELIPIPAANQIVPSHTGTAAGEGTPAFSGGLGLFTEPADTLPGTTRISLPKDGHFDAVVLGSSASSAYPRGEGALSGRLIHTVYLRVGQRKSWILQYCLPKSAAQESPFNDNAAPIEAPWPFLMTRPDNRNLSDDYVLVHGMVTAQGRFDQLVLTYPRDLAASELLMNSLKRWEFRPASRADQSIEVEVLLIIPREPE